MGLFDDGNRYYCITRPPAPGAIPAGAVDVHFFDERRYVPEIDRMAWGWAVYAEPLSGDDIHDYELIRRPVEG
jgi:hypothetical protein